VDSGIGIPEDLQKEIFKEFFQIGNPERDRTQGLGLGLD
jgi:two-component system, sensor histidine kinase